MLLDLTNAGRVACGPTLAAPGGTLVALNATRVPLGAGTYLR